MLKVHTLVEWGIIWKMLFLQDFPLTETKEQEIFQVTIRLEVQRLHISDHSNNIGVFLLVLPPQTITVLGIACWVKCKFSRAAATYETRIIV